MTCVCILTNLFPPVVSGSSTQSYGLAKKLSNQGHEVIVITAKMDKSDPDVDEIEGIVVYRLKSIILPKMKISLSFPWLNSIFSIRNLCRTLNIIKRHEVDIMHVHNHMFDSAFIASLVSFLTKVPFILTIHTIIKHNNFLFDTILRVVDRILLKWLVVRRASAVICPDVNVLNYLQEAFKSKCGCLIPYGIEKCRGVSKEEVQAIRDEYKLLDRNVILSLGHVHSLRDRRDLIAAMPEVLRNVPNTALLIVGAVTIKEPLDQVMELGLEGDVIFAGAQPHERIPAFLELCELEAHWLNQDIPERTSLGIASMEAMYYGRVIVAAANPDTFGKGVLKNQENIVIVEPNNPSSLANTLSELLSDRERLERISERSSETASIYFGWDSVSGKTLELYSSVLNFSGRNKTAKS